MESIYNVIAILTAGISLTMGFFSLLTFFQKSLQKADLAFGILCLLAAICILLPPAGFILTDDGPSSAGIKLKRALSLSFLAFLPWFIALYTGYKKKIIPSIVTASIVIPYLVMLFTSTDNHNKLWEFVAVMIMGIILAQGFYAGYRQYKNEQLLSNSGKESRLKKILELRENQWKSLSKDIQLIIINTDNEDRISYINPYGISLLKYKDESELLNTNWADHYLPGPQSGRSKTYVEGATMTGETITINRNSVLTKDGKEKIINWTSDVRYNDDGEIVGRMYIGSDITEQQEAIHKIKELKAELEKETLAPKEDSVASGINQDIIGTSRPFMYAIQKSKQVARTNASVLLLGETGVGKESFADLIQRISLRSNMPFIKVNCGALPAELIEDELFGHEKGAFTGAIQSRMGRFEKANGGTIFLDEIGELPLVLQPKLLRVLQNGEFERVGGHQTIKVDVRVIAATNNDLEKEVRENRFRDDLFYRLNVFPITIPPLRKRSADIMLLIQSFIERKSKEHGKHFENISKADMNRLCDYEWPGNIRELKNVIERAVISSDNQTLKLDWFYEDIEKTKTASTASLEEMETAYITKILQECNWKVNGENGAAEKLAMHPNTLRSRMKKLKISVPWKQDALNS